MKLIVITKAIIKQDQRVLLLKRLGGTEEYRGLYELPGGKLDFYEEPLEALRREVLEETGAQLETTQLYDVQSVIDNVHEKQYIIIVYIATIKPRSEIILSNEHSKYTWKKLSEIQLNEINDITKTVLKLQIESPTQNTDYSLSNNVVDNLSTNKSPLIIYCDGGSRGNPGPSASGFVIFDNKERLLFEDGKYLGITTNNQAEYQAVKFALEKALEMNATHLQFRLDSQLVVNQLTGLYQIKNRDLWPIHAHIKTLISRFEKVSFIHVRREFNKDADLIVNKILDARIKNEI